MPIIGSLPNTLTNGTTADANAVQANLQYIVDQVNANALSLAGGTMTGALINTHGFTGPLTGNADTATTATTASGVTDGAITPAKLSAGAPTWDGLGNLMVLAKLSIENNVDFNLRIEAGQVILQLGSTAGVNWNSGTQKLDFVNGSVTVESIDGSGNVIALGAVTQNGTP